MSKNLEIKLSYDDREKAVCGWGQRATAAFGDHASFCRAVRLDQASFSRYVNGKVVPCPRVFARLETALRKAEAVRGRVGITQL